MSSQKVIHVFSDSHGEVFRFIQNRGFLTNTKIISYVVGGATALGMVNPNSKTQALNKFKHKIAAIPKEHYLAFLLGEVDCGFVIWYRAEKYGEPVERQLNESLRNYFTFLSALKRNGYNRLLVASAPLPTIEDGQNWGEVANKRSEVKASLRDRTELTFKYNEKLKQYCAENGIMYVDTQSATTDPDTGLVSKHFLNRNPFDHHLENGKIAPVVYEELKKHGFE
ncbi:MAG TPA: hypothetical protein VFK27_00645 [Bacillales bacterium]|nr:hypothetical protein [Bacillales bacterium]